MRDRFFKTYEAVEKGRYTDPDDMISLSSKIEDIDGLRAEICRIPLKHNPSGYIQIMSKQDMAKLPDPIPSPNMGDACMMLMPAPPSAVQSKEMNFASLW